MRLVIDLQAAQGSNRSRGIGRYSLSLAQALARQSSGNELVVALNGALDGTVEPVRSAFRGLVPEANIRVWSGMDDVSGRDAANDWRRNANERLREAFLASLAPDVVLTASLFEGFDDDTVTSVGALTSELATAVTLYDLIPLVHRDTYLRHRALERWYLGKLAHLQRAELWLAISEHSRREAIELLGLPGEHVVAISGAADACFRPAAATSEQTTALRLRYGLARDFVMYTGGIDHRKNVDGLMRAYALLPSDLRLRHSLLVVCHAEASAHLELERARARLGLRPEEVRFSGFVPDEDLIALYSQCAAFIFPSWHEGFGLPVLEAMACGAPVIASNCSSLPEVVGRQDALFDPHNPADMARKLAQALSDKGYKDALRTHGLRQAATFSWDRSAKRALEALGELCRRQKKRASRLAPSRSRPHLIMVTPLPPERTGIADNAADLLPALARHYDIDVVVNQPRVWAPDVEASCRVRSLDWFRSSAAGCERIVYQMGDSHFHKHMPALLEEYPGVVVLHDFHLGGLFFGLEFSGKAPDAWSRALYEAHGYPALVARFSSDDKRGVVAAFPANLAVLRNAEGIIAHSRFACELAEQWYGEGASADWAVVPQAHAVATGSTRAAARRRLGIAEGDFIVCSFGIVAPNKLNDRLLCAWLISKLQSDGRARLVFVGDHYRSEYGRALVKMIHDAGSAGRIKITGFCNEQDYRRWLSAADVAVQLRRSTGGGTSRAVLDCMAAGLPLIVNANGTMRDFPMLAQVPDDFADSDLAQALESLRLDADGRREIGARAQAGIRERHAPRLAAAQFAATIEHFHAASHAGRRRLLASVAGLGGPAAKDDCWLHVSQSIARSLFGRMRPRQLLVDVTEVSSGQFPDATRETVQGAIRGLLESRSTPFRVEPVRLDERGCLIYARTMACGLLGLPDQLFAEDAIDFGPGDVYINPFAELAAGVEARLRDFRTGGGRAFGMLGPTLANIGGSESDLSRICRLRHLASLAGYHGIVCVSRREALALAQFLDTQRPGLVTPVRVGFLGEPDTTVRAALQPSATLAHSAPVSWLKLIEMLQDPGHSHWLARREPNSKTLVSTDSHIARVA